MQFWVIENGERVCYQAMRRNGKIYYRHCPVTVFYPSKGQTQVRYWFMKGAHEAALRNEDRDGVLKSTAEQPYHINPFIMHRESVTDTVIRRHPRVVQFTRAMMNVPEENVNVEQSIPPRETKRLIYRD